MHNKNVEHNYNAGRMLNEAIALFDVIGFSASERHRHFHHCRSPAADHHFVDGSIDNPATGLTHDAATL
jgi:hypothetical protein